MFKAPQLGARREENPQPSTKALQTKQGNKETVSLPLIGMKIRI